MSTEPSPAGPPAVSVLGEAVVRAEPDEAVVSLTLSALQDTPGPALQDVGGRGEALLALLDELSIARADRSTTGVSVEEEFDHTQDGRRSRGYRAASTVAVRLTDLDLIGTLITRATTELDAQVGGPRWQIAHENPARLEAARLAAADGQRKAQAYAEGVGARLGSLLGLAEPDAPRPTHRAAGRWAPAARGVELSVEAGDQEVAAAVLVTFALIS